MKKTSNTIIATLLLASTVCAYAGEMPAQIAPVYASINLSECKNRPNYPLDSARNEEQGTVIIRFLVSTEGKVIESVIERFSGFRALDMAAVDFFLAATNLNRA